MPLPVKAGAIFDMARFLLNDTDGAVYTDTVLTGGLKIAYDDLRMECEDNNIPFTNGTSAVILIPQGVVSIGGPGGPPLPTDLVEIIEMYERTAGTTNDFMQMRRMNFLPKTSVLTAYLEVWTWQKQIVNFLGATGNIEVKIDYVSNTLDAIINANTVIDLFNSKNFLGFRTAALAAEFIGENNTRAESLNNNASRALDVLENIGIKNQQSIPVRRRPFMSAYRQRGWVAGNR